MDQSYEQLREVLEIKKKYFECGEWKIKRLISSFAAVCQSILHQYSLFVLWGFLTILLISEPPVVEMFQNAVSKRGN
jgi:hypothetical protein